MIDLKKASQIFNPDIYFNTSGKTKMPLKVFIGARGRGKTFSTLRNRVYDIDKKQIIIPKDKYSGKFIYLRNTEKQIKVCGAASGNPFKKINATYNLDISIRKVGETFNIYPVDASNIKGIAKSQVPILGYGVSLNTAGNMRGVDYSDCDCMVFDEFIDPSERIRRLMKTAGTDFQMFRETVGRNRELEGEAPLEIYLLSNSVSLDSPILLELGIANTIANMIMKGQEKATIPEKYCYIQLIKSDEFTRAKSETTLYKASKEDSLFNQQALLNNFYGDNFDLIKKRPINEYIPKFTVNETLTAYRHKSRNEWFISSKSIQKSCLLYKNKDIDRLRDDWAFFYKRFVLSRIVYYDSYATKLVMDSLMDY